MQSGGNDFTTNTVVNMISQKINVDDKYAFSIAKPEHRNEIRTFLMKHFLVEETMNVATSITAIEFAPYADKCLERALKVPFSTIARSKESGDIIGVALNTMASVSDKEEVNPLTRPQRKEIEAIGKICDAIHHHIWNIIPSHVSTVLELEIISVGKSYQRQGIASRLLKENKFKEKIVEYKIEGFICQASSLANQMLLKKYNHTVIKEISFAHFSDDYGRQLISPTDGTENVILFWKAVDLEQPYSGYICT